MKEKFILFFTAIILSIGICGAKDQKIKYGKYVYYEGEVANKQPKGIGKLIFVSPKNKKQVAAIIEGIFDNNQIYDAKITSTILPNIKTIGEQPILFIPKGTIGKINDITFDFANVSFDGQRSAVTFGALSTKMEIENKEWKFIRPEFIPVMTDAIEVPLPSTITQYWDNPNNVLTYAKLNSGKMDIPSSKVIYNFGDYFLLKHFDISDKNKHAFYKGSVNVKEIDSPITANKNGFTLLPKAAQGTRILNDGTVIQRNSQTSETLEAISPSGDKYAGTVVSPLQPFSQSLKSFHQLLFKDGTFTTKTGITRYIGGESEDIIKNRLNNKGIVEQDLIEKVLTQEITESEAKDEHERRQEEQKRIQEEQERLEQENKELAAILKSKWNCEQIAFSCPIEWDSDFETIFSLMNLNGRCFDGTYLLGLQSDGKAVYGTIVTPSDKMRYSDKGQMIMVNDFCQKLTQQTEGRWSLRGNDILIDGTRAATLGKDGKTVLFRTTKMKIIKKL